MSLGKITGLYLIATTSSACILPFCGSVIKKLGVRSYATLVSLCLALACFAISSANSPVTLLFSFFGLRFFGQGNLFNVAIVFINNWWCESRGTAMGVAGAAVSAFLLGLTPIIMMHLIETSGWRGCYRYLGAAEVVGAVIAAITWREAPEMYGVLPDGKYDYKVTHGMGKRKNSNLLPPSTSGPPDANIEAPPLNNPTFLTYILGDLLMALTGTAFYFNLQQIVLDNPNIPDSTVTIVYPFMAVVGIVGRIVSGRMIDKLGHQLVFTSALAASSLSLLLIPTMNNFTILVAAPLMGYGMSASGNVRGTVHAEFYGRNNLGRLQSIASSATVLGSALGPFPFGVAHDMTGKFDAAMYAGGFASAVMTLVVFKFGANPRLAGREGKYEMVGIGGGREEEDVEDGEGKK